MDLIETMYEFILYMVSGTFVSGTLTHLKKYFIHQMNIGFIRNTNEKKNLYWIIPKHK